MLGSNNLEATTFLRSFSNVIERATESTACNSSEASEMIS